MMCVSSGYLTLRVQGGCVELHSQLFVCLETLWFLNGSFQSLEELSLGPCDWMFGECGWSFRVFNLWHESIVYVVSQFSSCILVHHVTIECVFLQTRHSFASLAAMKKSLLFSK